MMNDSCAILGNQLLCSTEYMGMQSFSGASAAHDDSASVSSAKYQECIIMHDSELKYMSGVISTSGDSLNKSDLESLKSAYGFIKNLNDKGCTDSEFESAAEAFYKLHDSLCSKGKGGFVAADDYLTFRCRESVRVRFDRDYIYSTF